MKRVYQKIPTNLPYGEKKDKLIDKISSMPSDYSNRRIARLLGVSHTYIARIRSDIGKGKVLAPAKQAEKDLETDFVEFLKKQGRAPLKPQVPTPAGKADVVDEEYVYELKITKGDAYKAVGQAVVYSNHLGKKPAVVLVHPITDNHKNSIENAGIKVILFPGNY